jgi:hypothetical protein
MDKLLEALRKEFERASFPNGRQAYVEEFEAKFDEMFNRIPSDIDRRPNPYWSRHDGS